MRLSEDFIVHTTESETLLVPSGGAKFSGVIKGNKIFGKIIGLLENDTTEQGIIASMRKQYDAPDGVIERDVRNILDDLRNTGALID